MTPKVLHLTAVDDSVRYILGRQLVWLKNEGFEVHVAASPGRHVRYVTETLGIPFHPVTINRTITPLSDLCSCQSLVRLFREHRFDIVHTHMPKSTLLGPIAARLSGVPIVVNTLRPVFHEGSPWAMRKAFTILDRVALGLTDQILAQNPDDVEWYAQLGICRTEKLSPLGNGIQMERFSPDLLGLDERRRLRREFGLPEDAFVIGMVGRYVRDKGYEEFFRAIRYLADQRDDVHYLTVGGALATDHGKLPPDLLEKLGLAGRGVRLGFEEEMPRIYAMMDVLLFPTHRDACPRVLMEAAAMGLPLVASDIRGCRHAVRNGENGFLVQLGDVATFARRVLDLAGSTGLRSRMGINSRKLALAGFDEREVFRRVADCYSELLARRVIPSRDYTNPLQSP